MGTIAEIPPIIRRSHERAGQDGCLMPVRVSLYRRDGGVVAHTTVDDDDFPWVARWLWRLSPKGYAYRWQTIGGKQRRIWLHREILGLAPGDKVLTDHRNRDKRDNRRENLRVVPSAMNSQNIPSVGSTSDYRGVSLDRRSGKWRAQITVHGSTRRLGLFSSEIEAARVARAARRVNMPFATD